MKKLFIFFILLFSWLSSFEQQFAEEIPAPIKAEIDAKLSVYGKRLVELRNWLSARQDQSGRPAANHVLFRWPMRANSNYDEIPSFYEIGNYIDINRDDTLAIKKDWYCNTGAEALNYKGHEGHDYSLYPFFWRMMENNNVFACAATAGIVIEVADTTDNNYNCGLNNEDKHSNHITVLNADSSISRYVHIKKGTALVTEGQFVEEGKLLCYIASSGRSSNPHLHFDLQYFRTNTGNYNFVDPSKKPLDNGICNPFTDDSWWQQQKNFIEPKLNRVMTHGAIPHLFGALNTTYNPNFCEGSEVRDGANLFIPGNHVTVGVALTHVSKDDSIFIRIYYPNGNLWESFGTSLPDNYVFPVLGWMRSYYKTATFQLPANAMEGTYAVQVDFTYRPFDASDPYHPSTAYVTKSYRHFFTVGCLEAQTLSGTTSEEWGHIVSNNIQSTQVVNKQTLYQAGAYIELKPGFHAQQGTTLKARIRPCDYIQ